MPDLTDPEVRENLSDRDGYLGEAARNTEEQVEDGTLDFEEDDADGGGGNSADDRRKEKKEEEQQGQPRTVSRTAVVKDPETGKQLKVTNPLVEASPGETGDPVYTPGRDEPDLSNPSLSSDAEEQVRNIQRKAERVKDGSDTVQTNIDTTESGVQIKVEGQENPSINSDKNQKIKVDSRTGQATEFGKQFVAEKRRLQDKRTFGLTRSDVKTIGAQLVTDPKSAAVTAASTNFDRESIQGELVTEGILGQLAEGGETKVETGASRVTPDFLVSDQEINQEVEDVGTLLGADFGVETETGRASPRKAFEEQIPELSVAQSRAAGFVSEAEKQVPDKRQDQIVQGIQTTTGESIEAGTAGLVDIPIQDNPVLDETSEKILSQTPGFAAQEVPEKLTETAALSSAGAATIRNPERVSREVALGSLEVGKKARENPVEFGVGELGVDIGLDTVTGGGAAVAVPAAEKVSAIKSKTGKAVTELKQLRAGAKNSPGVLDQTVSAGVRQGGLKGSEVLQTDTATPTRSTPSVVRDVGPGNTGSQTVDLVQPDSFNTLDTRTRSTPTASSNVLTELTPRTVDSVATGLDTRNDVITESSPLAESLALTETVPSTRTQTLSRSLTQTVPQSQAAALADTQTIAQPTAFVSARPQPVPKVLSEIENDKESKDDSGALFSTEKGRLYQGSVGAELLDISAEDKPGGTKSQNPLNLRPVVRNEGSSRPSDNIF